MLLIEEVPIARDTTALDLHDRLSKIGASMIVRALAGDVSPKAQSKIGVTYAAKLEQNEGRLDWSKPAAELERRIRALNPWPGVWFEYAGIRLKVLAADVNKQSGEAGTVLNNQFTIACGEGALSVKLVQKQGKSVMAAEDFLRGFDLPLGTRLI